VFRRDSTGEEAAVGGRETPDVTSSRRDSSSSEEEELPLLLLLVGLGAWSKEREGEEGGGGEFSLRTERGRGDEVEEKKEGEGCEESGVA